MVPVTNGVMTSGIPTSGFIPVSRGGSPVPGEVVLQSVVQGAAQGAMTALQTFSPPTTPTQAQPVAQESRLFGVDVKTLAIAGAAALAFLMFARRR